MPWSNAVRTLGFATNIVGAANIPPNCSLVLPTAGSRDFKYDQCPFTIISGEELKESGKNI